MGTGSGVEGAPGRGEGGVSAGRRRCEEVGDTTVGSEHHHVVGGISDIWGTEIGVGHRDRIRATPWRWGCRYQVGHHHAVRETITGSGHHCGVGAAPWGVGTNKGRRHSQRSESVTVRLGAPREGWGSGLRLSSPRCSLLSIPPPPTPQHFKISQRGGRAWRKGFIAQWGMGRSSGVEEERGAPAQAWGRALRSTFGGRWRARPRRTRVC